MVHHLTYKFELGDALTCDEIDANGVVRECKHTGESISGRHLRSWTPLQNLRPGRDHLGSTIPLGQMSLFMALRQAYRLTVLANSDYTSVRFFFAF